MNPEPNMSSFLAAAIQMNSQPNLDRNLSEAFQWVKQAAEQGANFIALPENFAFLGDEDARIQQADNIASEVNQSLASWAEKFGIYILGGGYPVKARKSKVYNRAILVNPEGNIVASYDKIHLFDVELSDKDNYRESDIVQAGRKKVVVYNADSLVCIGLSICYDIRFPELYRKLSEAGAELICVPSAFTRPTGKAHWEILLRSRAIENSAYLIAPAQTGKHGKKRKTYGHSMIVDPWGKILADAGTEPGWIIAEIDRTWLNEVRKKLPSLRHRVM